MKHLRKLVVPIIAVSWLCATNLLIVAPIAAQDFSPSKGAPFVPKPAGKVTTDRAQTKAARGRKHHTLYTQGGLKLLAYDNAKGYNAYLLTPQGKTFAKDGLYHLKGGGRIRARQGVIVWSDPTADRRYPSNYRSGVADIVDGLG